MNLLIFGPPGSGKGTYASRIAPKLGIVNVEASTALREIVKNGSELGKEVEGYMKRGELVPDDITIKVIEERLSKKDCSGGFILDGFPRTVEQAKFLEKFVAIDALINLLIPDELLVEKISARRMCKQCGNNYNIANINRIINGIKYNLPPMLPKKEGICDKCGGELYQRADDKPEVIKERIGVYKIQTEPVLNYYKNKIRFLDIICDSSPDIMAEKIMDVLKKEGLA